MAMNAEEFLNALDTLERERGISKENVLAALEDALVRAYKKQLGGDDADVRVDISLEKGTIDLYQVKKVVDEVVDDFLEISTEEANELDKSKKYVDGDEFRINAPLDELKKATAMKIKGILKQKFSEREKEILYDAYKDKIGTIIMGRVERVEDRGVSVNIGKASVYLPRSQMIGDERFNIGDPIKVYISDVAGDTKGAKINISRSSEGFLKCLFSDGDGIHDIYDGTIVIKAIARRAGERSKVAVYSNDPHVDPAATCIGPNGARIQRIVSQLGNGAIKEKIDIVTYSDIPALYIMESIKPAKALGVEVDEENKEAVVVVANDGLSIGLGKRGVNINLASRLTGYKLSLMTEEQANEDQIDYITYDQAQLMAARRQSELLEAKEAEAERNSLRGLPEGYVAPQERVYEEEHNDFDDALAEKVENEEPVIFESVNEETPVEEVKEAKKAPVKEKEEKKEEVKEVKTTTTLEDLEKSLEEDKNKKNLQKKKNTRKKKEEDEDDGDGDGAPVKTADPSTYMSIYTEEELRQMDEEEAESEEEDEEEIDYDEYDEYYDDDNR